MKSVGSFLRTHPVISLVILAGPLAIATYSSAAVRGPETDVVNTLLVGVVLALIAYGALAALVLLPRTSRGSEDQLAAVQWATASAIYLICWMGWLILELPNWLVVVGAVVGSGVLLVVIATNRKAHA